MEEEKYGDGLDGREENGADGSGEDLQPDENFSAETDGNAAEESAEKSKKFNGVALAGLILSAIGAVLGLLYAFGGKLLHIDTGVLVYVYVPCLIAGVIVSIAGAVVCKKFRNFRSGLAMAICGIVIGVIGLVASAIPLIILILVLTSIGKS